MLITDKTSGFRARLQAIFLAVVVLFCAASLAVSYLVPSSGIETFVQSETGVVIKRVSDNDALRSGDVILAINGRSISTRAELYYQLVRCDDKAELTVRRFGASFIRPITASAFQGDSLPIGLTESDKPVAISYGQAYTPLDGVDITQLKAILEENASEPASVIFKRDYEDKTVTLQLTRSQARTFTLSCILLMIALMAFVWMRTNSRNEEVRGLRINFALGSATIGLFWAALGSSLLAIPPLFLIGMLGMSLFKAFDLDFHIHDGGKKFDLWTRLILYLSPAVLMIWPIILTAFELPLFWGGEVSSTNEIRFEHFSIVPYILVIVNTLIDAGLSTFRILHGRQIVPRDIALYLGTLAAFASLFMLWSDPLTARWIIVTSIVIQCFGDAIECLVARAPNQKLSFDDDLFSAAPIREALKEADELLGGAWVVQVVIDRPEPRHVVGIALGSDEEDDVNGLSLHVLSRTWRDYLEIYRVEGLDASDNSPAKGIADRLGIVCTLPIAEKVGGSMTYITLLVSTHERPDAMTASTPSAPSVSQRAALRAIADQLACSDIALVYLCAEMSIEFLGDDLDEIASRIHATDSFPRALHDPTVPLKASEIPHGLLDEDELAQDNEPITIQDPEIGVDDYSTKVFDEEMNLLKSQVHTLCSQQIRAYALAEIEFTNAQKAVLEDLKSLETPIILAGEHGTGKTVLALSAHQDNSDGPFLQIDAADIPETILALDMFGDSENAGLIKSAIGGSLLIKNVDRLSSEILSDIMESIDHVASEGTVELYMTITLRDDEVSTAKYEQDPRELPARCRDLADHCDAEIVYLPPLHEQPDILNVAQFFMQRQAMRMNKGVLKFAQDVTKAITTYRWPGNVTELRSVIERAVMRTQSDIVTLEELGADFARLIDDDTRNAVLNEADIIQEQLEHAQQQNLQLQYLVDRLNAHIRELEDKPVSESEDPFLQGDFQEIEKRLLTRLLHKYHNDPDETVSALNTNRTKFFNKLRRYGLM